MANEFIIKNGFRSQGNSEVTGSLSISGGITGSLQGTASYAAAAVVFPYTGSAIITGSLIVTGSLTAYDPTNNNRVLSTSARTVWGANTSESIDWDRKRLYSTDGQPSVYWNTRLLYASNGSTVLDWQNATFTGSVLGTASYAVTASAISIVDTTDTNFPFYITYAAASGSTQVIRAGGEGRYNPKFNTLTVTASHATTASYATQALSASWAPAGSANTAVQFNTSGSFDGIAGVTINKPNRSFQNGNNAVATGNYSHAQGRDTQATGQYSHAEGDTATANGTISHAEGYYTTANGYTSHAEGTNTVANGYASHAEGYSTAAHGYASHTEGRSTATGNASGYYAEMTASGVFTISSSYGDVSTAGLFDAGYTIGVDDSQYDNTYTYANLIVTSCSFNGTNTIVHVTDTSFLTGTAIIGSISNFGNGGDRAWGGYAAHAQGTGTTALGAHSHAEGKSAGAYGPDSHAEGQGAAYGQYSHAEGVSTTYGQYSHAEGQSTAYGNYSHAEGEGSSAGYNGYRMNTHITAGVIELEPIYGDQTVNFAGGSFVIIYDNSGDIAPVNNTSTTYLYEVSSSAFTSSLTQITLVDNTVTTFSNFNRLNIGVYGTANPNAADVPLGNNSHAEGGSSKTLGEYSHAAGNITETLGWYQSVVGIGNKPISTIGAFIVGDGTTDGTTRHNLLVAASGSVTISGSLIVSGSIITNNDSITKNNVIANTSFGGTPLSASVSFTTAFPNTNYAITVTGEDARVWNIASKTAAGFIIESNSSVALTGNTYWQAASYGEFNG